MSKLRPRSEAVQRLSIVLARTVVFARTGLAKSLIGLHTIAQSPRSTARGGPIPVGSRQLGLAANCTCHRRYTGCSPSRAAQLPERESALGNGKLVGPAKPRAEWADGSSRDSLTGSGATNMSVSTLHLRRIQRTIGAAHWLAGEHVTASSEQSAIRMKVCPTPTIKPFSESPVIRSECRLCS